MSAAQTSLYHRLGGYDALAAAVDDLLPRLQGDPQLKDASERNFSAPRPV